jgi:hypothetical protein
MIRPQPPVWCSAYPKGPTGNVASQGSRWVCLYSTHSSAATRQFRNLSRLLTAAIPYTIPQI